MPIVLQMCCASHRCSVNRAKHAALVYFQPVLSARRCSVNVASEKATAPKMLYLELLSDVARYWTGQARLGLYLWICQRRMTAFPMIDC